MQIRSFLPTDAQALVDLFHQSVHRIAVRDYTPAQVAAWSPAPAKAEAFLQRAGDGRQIWVAVDTEDTPLGFIELESDGHIDRFYCAPNQAGTGVGSALYQQLESAARTAGLASLHVEASEAARRFFLKYHFTVDHRRDFEYGGVMMHNYRMSKSLVTVPVHPCQP